MKIVVLDGAILNPGDVDWKPIASLGELEVFAETDPRQLVERVSGASVILVNKTPLPADILPRLPDVRMVGVLATGYNNVAVEAFAARGVPVCNVVAYGSDDVAQHAMALLLELCRRSSQHTASVKSGEWARRRQWCYWETVPVGLGGLTMGIVGFGSIGRRVGELAHAFGMNVLAHSRTSQNPPAYEPFAFVSWERLLAESDVVSLHCPLTERTRNIINADSLARMRRGAVLINTSRGALVDEAAACKALEEGRLRGLGTDVLSVEPPEDGNPLLQAPNVLITPHIAWATVRARQNIIDGMAENIRRWREGRPVNVVNGVVVA